MAYIVDHAEIIKGNSVASSSLLIKNTRIDYISENLNRLPFMKMNVSNFLLTPGHVMLDLSFPLNLTFPQFKEYFQIKFLQNGCTTILIVCDVQFERELPRKLKSLRSRLLNCPIDYYICVKIPLRALTPSFIRQCKKNKIPAVFVEVDDEKKLADIAWGWLRDAFFGYRLPLIPIWKIKDTTKITTKKWNAKWQEYTKLNDIPAIPYDINEQIPLNKDILKKIGIYPAKGDIRIGGEVDYNLYFKEDVYNEVAQNYNVDYHIHSPKITVHKNNIIKVDNKINFRPGFGNECNVKIPGFFKAYF